MQWEIKEVYIMEEQPVKTDMSLHCGMHYFEYWVNVHMKRTMTQEAFDKWLEENCYLCNQMSDVCMKE